MALFDTIRAGAAGAAGDYEIQRSIRLNGETDDAYFKRTSVSSPTNVKIWTMSLWIKRDGLVNGNDMEMLFGNDYYTGSISTRGFQFAVGRNDFKFETFDGASGMGQNVSTGEYRDSSAWMHVVVQCDTTQGTQSNRMRVYTNGTDIGLGNSISQNQELTWNKASRVQYLGCHDINGGPTRFYRGYIAEAHFVDGQSLDPSNFAETDAVTGFYKPIEYSGTYGNNGWYMAFTDNSNTTATTLGKDYSGNGNNMTPFNFSVSSGVGNDSVTDTPTNNWTTMSPNIRAGGNVPTYTNGNLSVQGPGSGIGKCGATCGLSSGKWYVEAKITHTGSNLMLGIINAETNYNNNEYLGSGSDYAIAADCLNTRIRKEGSNNQTGLGGMQNGDILAFAVDMDNGTFQLYNNGSTKGSQVSFTVANYAPVTFAQTTGADSSKVEWNFGQQGFTYTPPTGFKAPNSQNLPEPTAPRGDKYFNAITYSGTGSQRAVTGFDFAPDWVWVKRRNNNNFHILANTILGAGNYMVTNTVDAESSGGSQLINGFNSDGFDVGTEAAVNNSSGTYVAWCWFAGGSTATNSTGTISAQVRASSTAGFSIMSWTGNGTSGATVGHGLGVKPSFFIVKQRNGTGNWVTYDSFNGATKHFTFTSNASSSYSGLFNDTEPTSSVISLGNDVAVNVSSNPYICYCFAEILGFSKFGIYTGSGNSDGAFVFTGFRPRYVIVKRSDSGNHWVIYDAARSTTNVIDDFLKIELQDSEVTNSQVNIDFYANGFKLRSAFDIVNAGSGKYFFFAFAENAFKYARAR